MGRTVVICQHHDSTLGRSRLTQCRQLGAIHPDHSGHATRYDVTRFLHQAPTFAHQAQRVDEGRVGGKVPETATRQGERLAHRAADDQSRVAAQELERGRRAGAAEFRPAWWRPAWRLPGRRAVTGP